MGLGVIFRRMAREVALRIKSELVTAAEGEHLWFAVGFHMRLLELKATERVSVPLAFAAYKLGPRRWQTLGFMAEAVKISAADLGPPPKMSG